MSKIWKDVCIRESSCGYHYLLQVCELESGKKIFRNRPIDKCIINTILFHGFQGLTKLNLT